jgi:hypothetical protein
MGAMRLVVMRLVVTWLVEAMAAVVTWLVAAMAAVTRLVRAQWTEAAQTGREARLGAGAAGGVRRAWLRPKWSSKVVRG